MPAILSKSEKSKTQRNYAITCNGVIVVLQTLVSGSLYIMSGNGKQKCIEIKIDAASVGQAVRPGDVVATVRTLSADGVPQNDGEEDEEEVVKVEVLGGLEDHNDTDVSSSSANAATEDTYPQRIWRPRGPSPEPLRPSPAFYLPISETRRAAAALAAEQREQQIADMFRSSPEVVDDTASTTSNDSPVSPKGKERAEIRDSPEPKAEADSFALRPSPAFRTRSAPASCLGASSPQSTPPDISSPDVKVESRLNPAPSFSTPASRGSSRAQLPSPESSSSQTPIQKRTGGHASGEGTLALVPATPSPKKRAASQMDGDSAVDGGRSGGSESRKRAKVGRKDGSPRRATRSQKLDRD
ncbi:hypothetical protein B0H11DRAFT_1147545 [Mycena galericulata]|nr:hypothetical protein B0H11DRAFT_1147545 [Mycena galericulata]